MTNRVVVIDYGMGNLHSAASALEHVAPDAEVIVSGDAEVIASADRVVFPGVGAMRDCMAGILGCGHDAAVKQAISDGKPVLAICVGMQALFDHSEENGGVEGLKILPGEVKFFGQGHTDVTGEHLKVPHMGWNQVKQIKSHPLWNDIADDTRFYFVHSFYVSAADQSQVAGSCDYGHCFDAVLAQDNLFAVQFHPEKSHTAGLQLLKNFMNWDGKA